MTPFRIEQQSSIPTPALIYHKDNIGRNIRKAISLVGSADRIRPHVKSHKTEEIVRMQMSEGITRFKCATIAEAEMIAMGGGPDVLIAYPLVGPNVERFVTLVKTYPDTLFSAVVESEEGAAQLGEEGKKQDTTLSVFLELDPGLHRTGISIGESALRLYEKLCSSPVFTVAGLHCYDGHIHQEDLESRKSAAGVCYVQITNLKNRIEERGLPVPQIVIGGTPSFALYASHTELQVSPGTCFLHDWGYAKSYAELKFDFAAVILSRVISVHPQQETFTIDVGCKAIASDPKGERGIILDLPDAVPLYQNEEHWVFRIRADRLPLPGTEVQVLPTHICPTSALYDEAHIVDDAGTWSADWKIKARSRKLTI